MSIEQAAAWAVLWLAAVAAAFAAREWWNSRRKVKAAQGGPPYLEFEEDFREAILTAAGERVRMGRRAFLYGRKLKGTDGAWLFDAGPGKSTTTLSGLPVVIDDELDEWGFDVEDVGGGTGCPDNMRKAVADLERREATATAS